MIRVKKAPKPQILKDNDKKWNKKFSKAWKKYKKEGGTSPKANYNKPSIKSATKNEFAGKCAFCETYVPHTYYGDIEHFRPKSKYCKYAHTWSNLLFSCRICNGNKGNDFPMQDQIIKPTTENPEIFFEYEKLFNGSWVILKAVNNRAQNSIDLMKLNRDDLSSYRGKQYKKLQRAIDALRDAGADQQIIEDTISLYMTKDEEYSGMFKFLHENNMI